MILQGKLLTWLLPPLPGSSQLLWFSFLSSSKIKALVSFCCVIPQGLCTYGASFSLMDSWVSFKVLVRCCLFPQVLCYPPTLLSPKKLLPSPEWLLYLECISQGSCFIVTWGYVHCTIRFCAPWGQRLGSWPCIPSWPRGWHMMVAGSVFVCSERRSKTSQIRTKTVLKTLSRSPAGEGWTMSYYLIIYLYSTFK